MYFSSDLNYELEISSEIKWRLNNIPVNHYFFNLANYFEMRTPFYSLSQRRLYSGFKIDLINDFRLSISVTPLQKYNEVFSFLDVANIVPTSLYFTGSSHGGVRQPIVSKKIGDKLKPLCNMQQFYQWIKTSDKANDWMLPLLTEESFKCQSKCMETSLRIYSINLGQTQQLSLLEKNILKNYSLKSIDSLAVPFTG